MQNERFIEECECCVCGEFVPRRELTLNEFHNQSKTLRMMKNAYEKAEEGRIYGKEMTVYCDNFSKGKTLTPAQKSMQYERVNKFLKLARSGRCAREMETSHREQTKRCANCRRVNFFTQLSKKMVSREQSEEKDYVLRQCYICNFKSWVEKDTFHMDVCKCSYHYDQCIRCLHRFQKLNWQGCCEECEQYLH